VLPYAPLDSVSELATPCAIEQFDEEVQELPDWDGSDAETLDEFAQANDAQPRKQVPVPYYSQQYSMWCAPATGQMILEHRGHAHAQGIVADKMRTDIQTGTTDDNQMLGYRELSSNQLSATISIPPTFQRVTAEIDAGRALKRGQLYHATATIGYESTHSIYEHDPRDGSDRLVPWSSVDVSTDSDLFVFA
jgi:hypothetical protein